MSPSHFALDLHETDLLVETHRDVYGHLDNLGVSIDLLDEEPWTARLAEAREQDLVSDLFSTLVPESGKKRQSEDRPQVFPADLDGVVPRDIPRRPDEYARDAERMISALSGGGFDSAYVHRHPALERFSARLMQQAEARFGSAEGAMGKYWKWQKMRWGDEDRSPMGPKDIAELLGLKESTVRGGLKVVRDALHEMAYELRSVTAAPRYAKVPDSLAEGYRLREQRPRDLAALAAEIERTRADHVECPHWYVLRGQLAFYQECHEEAASFHGQGLQYADEPAVRVILLNNQALAIDALADGDDDRRREADRLWYRAHRLDPKATSPLFNLLCNAAQYDSWPECQILLDELEQALKSRADAQVEAERVMGNIEREPAFETWFRRDSLWLKYRRRWRKAFKVALTAAILLLGFGQGLLASGPDVARIAEYDKEEMTHAESHEERLRLQKDEMEERGALAALDLKEEMDSVQAIHPKEEMDT